jgi:hypothetical protein
MMPLRVASFYLQITFLGRNMSVTPHKNEGIGALRYLDPEDRMILKWIMKK